MGLYDKAAAIDITGALAGTILGIAGNNPFKNPLRYAAGIVIGPPLGALISLKGVAHLVASPLVAAINGNKEAKILNDTKEGQQGKTSYQATSIIKRVSDSLLDNDKAKQKQDNHKKSQTA